MMKKYLFFVLMFATIASCQETKSTQTEEKITQAKTETTTPKTPIAHNEETPNSVVQSTNPPTTKHGVTFAIPEDWTATTSELKATDLKGNITAIQSEYDTKNNAKINITFYPGKNGQQIYEYKAKGKKAQHIKINGKDAIKTIESLKTNGKGHALKSPKKRTIISLQTDDGAYEFIINTNNEAAENTFNDFISNLKFQTK